NLGVATTCCPHTLSSPPEVTVALISGGLDDVSRERGEKHPAFKFNKTVVRDSIREVRLKPQSVIRPHEDNILGFSSSLPFILVLFDCFFSVV
ncbi:hypothetical protein, partial [Hallella bergensis]|uniref:hypothetical protein n=1 Tax=Hallella bergensis TaxID=242750 RepID=UPI0023F1C8DF